MNCKQAGLFLSGATLLLSLPACNGIFEGIYDMPTTETGNEYGFILIDEGTRTGRIYIDATDYTEWHYVDLHDKQLTTTQVGDAAPETWDFAVHRYDTKTNGGTVWESQAGSFDALPAPESVSEEQWTDRRPATSSRAPCSCVCPRLPR